MKLLITTSTLPVSSADEVPDFVKKQAIFLKKYDPNASITIHAPHNHYSNTRNSIEKNNYYKEIRFHYFWPFCMELLTGRGVLPALRANKLLYCQIPFLFIFQFISLFILVSKEKPDLIYAHWFTPQAITSVMVSMLTGIPFVFTTHASDISVLRSIPFAKYLVRWVCRNSKAYTAVSERTAQKLIDFFNAEEWNEHYSKKLKIIPMGVDINRSSFELSAFDYIKKKYSLDDRPIILFLGRLAEKKGVEYLLEAFSLLPKKQREKFQLVIAGDGQLKNNLKIKARSLKINNIYFTGYVHGEEKYTFLNLADYLCLPSIIDSTGDSEGFPVVLMEGLAAGKVILASNVSGGEVIFKNKKNCFVFTQKSSEELKAKLSLAIKLTTDELEVIRRENKKLAKQFGWETITINYYNFLKGAISNVL